MPKLEPTQSRTIRDEYSDLVVKICRQFRERAQNDAFGTGRKNESFARTRRNRSYDPSRLIRSLDTKIGKRSIVAIGKAIQFQLVHGVKLAFRQLSIVPTTRFRGRFINQGTLETLTNVNVNKVKSIQQKYLDDLKIVIARAVGGGTISWNDLVVEIKKLGKLNDFQAERIARTEVIRTVTAGMGDLYKKMGVDRWRWVSTIDERTSRVCTGLDNKVVEIGKPFTIDQEFGPIYKPPAHPNCRSGVEPIV